MIGFLLQVFNVFFHFRRAVLVTDWRCIVNLVLSVSVYFAICEDLVFQCSQLCYVIPRSLTESSLVEQVAAVMVE